MCNITLYKLTNTDDKENVLECIENNTEFISRHFCKKAYTFKCSKCAVFGKISSTNGTYIYMHMKKYYSYLVPYITLTYNTAPIMTQGQT